MNKLFLVGLGPGNPRGMTEAARTALEQAEVLCGYTVYLDLVEGTVPGEGDLYHPHDPGAGTLPVGCESGGTGENRGYALFW